MASVVIGGIGLALGGASTTAVAIGVASMAAQWALAPDVKGPRLKNLQPPESSVGQTITKGFGKTPAVGTIIWATPIKEHESSSSAKGGGKGGPRQISYSYSGSYTLSFGMGPVTRIAKIVLGSKPIYDWNGGAPLGDSDYLGKKKNNNYFTPYADATFKVEGAGTSKLNGIYRADGTFNGATCYRMSTDSNWIYLRSLSGGVYTWGIDVNKTGSEVPYYATSTKPIPPTTGWTTNTGDGYGVNPAPTVSVISQGDGVSSLISNNGKVRIRLGTESQTPDPAEEAAVGVGNASAYRGLVTITFEDLNLDKFGGQWPQVTVLLDEPTTNVAAIAGWICDQAKLDPADYEFCEIADISVTGFVMPQQQAAQAYMEQLGLVAVCDFPERDWKLRAIKRGRSVGLTIPSGDLQSHDVSTELPDFIFTRSDEVTLPRQMDVTYIDSSRNYTTATASAWREVDGESGGIQSVDLSNVVMSNAEARRYGEIGLYTALSQNVATSLSLPGCYAYLANGDAVSVETSFGTVPLLLQSSQEGLFGNVVFSAVGYRKSAYDFELPENTAGLQPSLVQVAGDYYYAVIDTNLLSDNNSGVPLLMIALTTPEGTTFNDVKVTSASFSVSQSSPTGNILTDLGRVFNPDNSTTNDNQFNPGSITIKNPANLGEVVGTLGAYPYGTGTDPGSFDLVDDVNTLTVDMIRGSCSSITYEQFIQQTVGLENTCVVGREIVKYQTATFVGTFAGRKRYALTGLLRGRRGTEWYSDQHHPNEAFVDADSNLYYAQMLQGAIGQTIELDGGDPNGSTQQSISLSVYGNSLMPYSPHALRATRDSSGNMTIHWDRRSRMSDNSWWSTGAAPALGEATESYDVEIMDTDGSVLRTYTGLTANSLSYSASDQINDFGQVMASVPVTVYQNSAIVGRGYPAYLSV